MTHPSPWSRRAWIGAALGVILVAFAVALADASPATAAPAAASITVSAPASASVGGTVQVSTVIHGATSVFGYEIVLHTDPTVLRFVTGSASGPSGGFDNATSTGGDLTLVHTRLGTSPALSGDLTATASFVVVGSGSASVAVSGVTLVDSAAATTSVPTQAATTIVVATTTGTATGTGATAGTGTSPAVASAPGRTPMGALANTGVGLSIGALVAAGLAIVVGGVVLVRRRMRSAR